MAGTTKLWWTPKRIRQTSGQVGRIRANPGQRRARIGQHRPILLFVSGPIALGEAHLEERPSRATWTAKVREACPPRPPLRRPSRCPRRALRGAVGRRRQAGVVRCGLILESLEGYLWELPYSKPWHCSRVALILHCCNTGTTYTDTVVVLSFSGMGGGRRSLPARLAQVCGASKKKGAKTR